MKNEKCTLKDLEYGEKTENHGIENAVFLPLDGFSSLVEDQVTIGVWVHFWVFNSIPLVYLSVSIPVPCSFLSQLLCSKALGQAW